ncbi:MAG TPA: lysylphosphatidylglycerol synthase transmembrane domain-containing protein [Gaiella sp.]|jgi:uncharacterized membrane protein YbhN (UPF0104 family)
MSGAEIGTPRVAWRRVALGGTLALLVAVGVILLIGRAAGFAKLEETLRAGAPMWLAICAAGQVAVFAGYAGVYREAVAFEQGPRVGVGLSLRVVMASFGLTQLVAAGGAAALAVTYWALRRLGFGTRDAAVRLVGLNTLVYLVFGLVGWAAALVALVLGEAPFALAAPWLVLIPVLLLAARWFTAPVRVERWVRASDGWFRRALSLGVDSAWWVRRVVATRRPAMVAWALCYWAGDVASLWGALRAFDAAPGLAALTLAYATGYVAQMVPLPLIATGGVDAATTFALTAVGVPLEAALLGVVAHRVFAFWLPLVPGLVLAALLPRTGRRLEGVVTTSARAVTASS